MSESSIVTSLTMNFDNSRIAVGTTDGNGTVRIYDYDLASNTWSGTHILNGPSSGSGFGQSMDMDWAGTRLAVGANTVSQVYVYDFDGSTWNLGSNVITSPSGSASDFGFSVSISKDIPDTIAVGAPAHNNVHVYHIINDAWSEAFSNLGTDIQNIAPIDTSGTNNYVLKPEFNRYGECVRLSSLGDYLIVGQPGTVLSELNSTNTDGLSITVDVSSLQQVQGEYIDSFGVNQNRQQGSARVFKTDSTWNVSNVQVGSLLKPDVSCVISDSERTTFTVGWSFPGFGMQVDISSNGDIVVVSAPLFSVKGGDYTYHNGQIYTFIYVDDEWVKQDVFTGFKQTMFGKSMKLDYTGERIAISGSNKRLSHLNISDWNGNSWYGARPDIVYSLGGNNSNFNNKIYITNGEVVPRSIGPATSFFDYLLTQTILGNNLVRGYLAADELYVGANDNDNNPSQKFSTTKRISFGGTYLDNTYEGATIENRMYKIFTAGGNQGNEGRSELLIAKTNQKIGTSESGGVDLIRLKAHEIHLDSHSLYNDYDNKYVNNPTFVLNYERNVSIGLPFLNDVSGPGAFFRGTADAKAKLDVNGSTYIRNRLNVNVDGGCDVIGNIGEQPHLFFDTRNTGSVSGSSVYSNTMVNRELANITGTINFPATYASDEHAFYIPSSGGIISVSLTCNNNYARVSLWFKLLTLPTGDTKVFEWYSTSNPFTIYVTTSGFKININNTSEPYTYTFTHTVGTWVHITFYGRILSGALIDSFHINGVLTNPISEPATKLSTIPNYLLVTIGGGSNMYIGMPMIWTGYAYRSPTALMLYNNGPPSEMLKVGGDAVVTGKLGVGVTNPTEALEVSGTVKATTFSGSGSSLTNVPGSSVTGTVANAGYAVNAGTAASINFSTVNDDFNGDVPFLSEFGDSLKVDGDGSFNYNPFENTLYCISFASGSDIRIKTSINDIHDASALETFRLLQPKTYKYVDRPYTETVYGFLAQDVLEVLPYAVTKKVGNIPNIMSTANVVVVDDSLVDLHLDNPTSVELSNTSILNINSGIYSNVVSKISDSVIRVEHFGDFDNVFVRGERVPDFHHLKKDAIFTVATAALQEVDRQLQAEKTKVANLEAQLTSVLARLDALENPP